MKLTKKIIKDYRREVASNKVKAAWEAMLKRVDAASRQPSRTLEISQWTKCHESGNLDIYYSDLQG